MQHLQGSEQAVPGARLEHWCSPLSHSLFETCCEWESVTVAPILVPSLCHWLCSRQGMRGKMLERKVFQRTQQPCSETGCSLSVCLLLAAGFPNPSFSGSALLVCLPAPIQHCREMVTLPKSLPPGAFSIIPKSWSLAAHTEQCPARATVTHLRHQCPAQEPMCTQSQE